MAAELQNADPRALSADYETRKQAEITEWLIDNDNEPNGQIYACGSSERLDQWSKLVGWNLEKCLAAYKEFELRHPLPTEKPGVEQKPFGPELPPAELEMCPTCSTVLTRIKRDKYEGSAYLCSNGHKWCISVDVKIGASLNKLTADKREQIKP